jgi:phosphomethylpyrimidine synthase
MKTAHFCSPKITQDVRDEAGRHRLPAEQALEQGLRENAVAFVRGGAELYRRS